MLIHFLPESEARASEPTSLRFSCLFPPDCKMVAAAPGVTGSANVPSPRRKHLYFYFLFKNVRPSKKSLKMPTIINHRPDSTPMPTFKPVTWQGRWKWGWFTSTSRSPAVDHGRGRLSRILSEGWNIKLVVLRYYWSFKLCRNCTYSAMQW